MLASPPILKWVIGCGLSLLLLHYLLYNSSLTGTPILQHIRPSVFFTAPQPGRVLVTGGAGNIGKRLVERLLATSTPVTILDKIVYQDEFDNVPGRSLLTIHVGDIRNTTVLDEALTADVVGIIHLAAVSRVVWCLQNEADCTDVNERGTKIVLDALGHLSHRDGKKRWFVLASSREVYGSADGVVEETAPMVPTNVYGASKLAAENVVKKYFEEHRRSKISVIAMRLSNVSSPNTVQLLHLHTKTRFMAGRTIISSDSFPPS